jgi:nucleotide-binding universal stress UspA family protein
MKRRKERLTVTVDPSLVEAASAAVKAGRADSLSAWVSLALVERAEKERRLAALEQAIRSYEEQFGELGAEELARQARADRVAALVVRGRAPQPRRRNAKQGSR